MKASPPRVLLIEDDASLRRFVLMALDGLGIELRCVTSVEEGIDALAEAPVALIVTDLMLPGRSGFDLIDVLAAQPRLRGSARLVVFSAGLDLQTRQRLTRPDVWRLLSKPCSVGALEDCVREGVALAGGGLPDLTRPPEAAGSEAQARAVDEHFDGDTALYRAFRASCLVQFLADMAEGDRACAASDVSALRRLAHALKPVLLTLGHPEASDVARALEDACQRGDWHEAAPRWETLRTQVAALV